MRTLRNLGLFRQGHGGPPLLRRQRQRDAVGPPEPVLRRILSPAGSPSQIGHVVLLRHPARRAVGAPVQREPAITCGIDRKSTRLNSSHGYISYAVFCLKKKKNETQTGV